MKAKVARAKDDRDLEVILPRLDDATRAWLRNAIELVHPGHRWLEHLLAS